MTYNFTRQHAGVRGHLYAADKVRSLIDQEGAVALRIHFAHNGRQPALVLMGVDREGDAGDALRPARQVLENRRELQAVAFGADESGS